MEIWREPHIILILHRGWIWIFSLRPVKTDVEVKQVSYVHRINLFFFLNYQLVQCFRRALSEQILTGTRASIVYDILFLPRPLAELFSCIGFLFSQARLLVNHYNVVRRVFLCVLTCPYKFSCRCVFMKKSRSDSGALSLVEFYIYFVVILWSMLSLSLINSVRTLF